MQNNFDPMTGERLIYPENDQPPKKHGKGLKIIGIVAGIAVVLVIGSVVVKALVLGKNGKIITAAANTFEQTRLMKTLDLKDTLESGKYEVEVKGDGEDMSAHLLYDADIPHNKQSLYGKIGMYGMDFDFRSGIDDSTVKVSLPDLCDETIIYNYQQENSGYLIEELSEYYDVKELNNIIANFNSMNKRNQIQKKMLSTTKELINDLDFKNASSAVCYVNDNNRRCKGYRTVVDEKTFTHWCDEYQEILEDSINECFTINSVIQGNEDEESADYYFDKLKEQAESMDDLSITVYLYQNQIAEILIEGTGENHNYVEIDFEGGSFPMENMKIIDTDDVIFERSGSTDNGVEQATYYIDDEKVVILDYDYENGDLNLEIGDIEYEDSILINGCLNSYQNGFELEISSLSTPDEEYDFEGSISVSSNPSVKSVSTADGTFDIGNASMDEFTSFFDDIESEMYGWEDYDY